MNRGRESIQATPDPIFINAAGTSRTDSACGRCRTQRDRGAGDGEACKPGRKPAVERLGHEVFRVN